MKASDKAAAPRVLETPRSPVHTDLEVTVDTRESSAPHAYPSTEDQDHPHACLNGYIYIGYTVFDEEMGEEIERVEALLCRRCAEQAR